MDFSCSNDLLMIIKGKHTKRPSLTSPLTQGATSCFLGGGESSCTSNCISPDIASSCYDPCLVLASKTLQNDDSDELSHSTLEEDEDMANCLILLAQSGGCVNQEGKQSTKRLSEIVSNSTTKIKSEVFVYQCTTCNRNFPSFQALGGHRASHKKPKILVDDKKALFTSCDHGLDHQEEYVIGGKFTRLSGNHNPRVTVPLAHKGLDGNVNKSKIHMCSICGSEFSSGQALGGHMRRHRNALSSKAISFDVKHVESEVPRRIFALDLNLPAPEDDQRDLKFQFQFAVDQKHLVLTAPALVDCHY